MLNRHEVIGYLGRDPELRYMPNGKAVVNITIATSEKWTDQNGEKQEATEWHRCTAFDKLAEAIGKYAKKGTLMYCAGKSKPRKYTDKDGVERYATEISINEMKLLPTGERNGEQSAPAAERRPAERTAPQPAAPGGFDDMEDDIPFFDPLKRRAVALAI